MIKSRAIVLLFILFIGINTSIFYITKINSEDKIQIVLDDKLETLTTHYEILLHTQHLTAESLYLSTIRIQRLMEILAEANDASTEKKALLREELHKLLKIKYEIAKKNDVLQYHFVLKDNESFYRAHKPSKFGDNLTDIRADFKKTNETKKIVSGFTQGRTAHGFRNVFPIFDKEGKHIGAMEVSFSSDSFQWYLNNISQIHSHFLVDKKIFNTKAWSRDDLIIKYEQSSESANYMLTLGEIHTHEKCIEENSIRIEPIQNDIAESLLIGEPFSNYVETETYVAVLSFVPIENLKDEVLAWIVSYENAPIIKSTLLNIMIIRIVSFLISLLIVYLLIRQIQSKQKIKKQHQLLNEILNSTDNMMLITDFKDVKFANNKFREILNISHIDLYNSACNHNMLNMFLSKNAYLHSGLLKEDEGFNSLIDRTSLKDRIVAILDENNEAISYKISISESENKGDFLVTLSDITKLKEHQLYTEKKAYIDSLTKIYNRNKFDEVFEEEIKNTQRYNIPLSVALIDIDKFKDFNDTYGHLIGDEVLVNMANVVTKNIRETDVFARWGGEEFILLFKHTDIELGKEVSQKLREKIEENEHPIAGSITASFGLTQYRDGDTTESIFKRCDKALYRAKENGRNRVEVI